MNIQLMQNSDWVYIIYIGILSLVIIKIVYSKVFKELMKECVYAKKALISMGAGAIVTLLVNDSGVVSAATTMLYIAIPFLIIIVNKIVFKDK